MTLQKLNAEMTNEQRKVKDKTLRRAVESYGKMTLLFSDKANCLKKKTSRMFNASQILFSVSVPGEN